MFRLLRAAALCALAGSFVLGGTVDAATSPVKVTLKCYSNPERTTIKNIGTSSFKIKSFGSTYDPYAGEPFRLSKTLAPGESITYLTGRAGSGPNKLYGNYIYNDNGRDGAKVVTTAGTVTKHC